MTERPIALPLCSPWRDADYSLPGRAAVDPEAVRAMSTAFDGVCKSLGLRAAADPAAEVIAKKIIELAQRGVRDPTALGERVLRELDLNQ